MNLFTRTFSKIFKSSNQQELDKLKNLIEAINNKESTIKSLTEGDFKEKHLILKKRSKWILRHKQNHSRRFCVSKRGCKKNFRRETL